MGTFTSTFANTFTSTFTSTFTVAWTHRPCFTFLSVSKQEFRDCMKTMQLNLSEAETRALMRKFSKNGDTNGSILYKDFCQFLSPQNKDLSYLERRLRTRLRELARIKGGVRETGGVQDGGTRLCHLLYSLCNSLYWLYWLCHLLYW